MSVKKIVAGEGDWTCVKDVLGWILDTEAGTVTFLERKLEELLILVDIPATHCRMGRKDLECLVGKLRLYAPCGARSSGPPLPHSLCSESGRSGTGMATVRLSSGACPPGGIPSDTPGRNCSLGTNPSRVL